MAEFDRTFGKLLDGHATSGAAFLFPPPQKPLHGAAEAPGKRDEVRCWLLPLSHFALVFAMSMAYNIIMEFDFLPQVVVETLPYQRAVNDIWDTETQIDFKNYIGMHPMQGDTIPGTGGVRKIRWQGIGHGKRGGIRVIYYLYNENHPIYLLYAYPKNAKANLSDSEKKAFREVAEKLKQEFRRKEEHRYD